MRRSFSPHGAVVLLALAGALASGAYACGDADTPATDNRGGDTAGSGGTGGDTAGHAGASSGGAAGGTDAAGAGGMPNEDPGFHVIVETLVKRPGRPRSLQSSAGRLLWILAPADGSDAAGTVETLSLDSLTVRPWFESEPKMWSAAVAGPTDPFFAATGEAGGGLFQQAKSGNSASERVMSESGWALDLAVAKGSAYGVLAGDHNESWVQAADLSTGKTTRVSQAKEPDAYVGGLVVAGDDVYFSMEAFGAETGFYRIAGGSTAATRLPGAPPAGARSFNVIGEELAYFEDDFGASEQRLLARSLADGSERLIATTKTLDYISPPIPSTIGLWFFVAAGSHAPDGTRPWGIASLQVPSPATGGTLRTLADVCPSDAWLPGLVTVDSTLYVSCPSDGTIKRVTIVWHV